MSRSALASDPRAIPDAVREDARLRRRRAVRLFGAVLLAVYYTLQYLSHPALPGNRPAFPLGWWGWFDQSKTLESAQAFAHGDFAAVHHWYPLGYSLLGALFYTHTPTHPFFFVDLACLLIAYWAFVTVARRIAVPTGGAIILFLLTAVADPFLFQEWVIPWNTSPSGALIWLLLAVVAVHMDGVRRPFIIGLLAGAIPLFRPTEALLVAPCVLAALISDLHKRRLSTRDCLRFVLGVALPVLPYIVLYLAIYGPHPSEYMVQSRRLGCTLYDLGWKAYIILLDPRPWFLEGEGFLRRCPWIALAIAGLVPALQRGRIMALLAVVIVLNTVLYLSYVDLLPTGFWLYNNVHYWTWALPGYGLLAVVLVQDLFARGPVRRRIVAGLSLVVTALLLCVHLDPRPVAPDTSAKMVEFPGPATSFDQWSLSLRDQVGEMKNVYDMRAVPVPGGLRIFALRRDFVGPVHWVPGHAPPGTEAEKPPVYWDVRFSLGLPCWLLHVRACG